MGTLILIIGIGAAIWYFYADEIKSAWDEFE